MIILFMVILLTILFFGHDHHKNDLEVQFKKLHPDAKLPQYAHNTDAGLDLSSVTKEYVSDGSSTNFAYLEFGTGLAVEVPKDHVGLIFPRSSISNTSMVLSNAVGVLDSGYRGEIKFRFKCLGNLPEYKIGEKIGQLIIIPYPRINIVEVEELSDSDRGKSGFGSSGV